VLACTAGAAFAPPTFAGLDKDKSGGISKEEVAAFFATAPANANRPPAEQIHANWDEQGRLGLASGIRRSAAAGRSRWRAPGRISARALSPPAHSAARAAVAHRRQVGANAQCLLARSLAAASVTMIANSDNR
jgi:hypothetical protein